MRAVARLALLFAFLGLIGISSILMGQNTLWGDWFIVMEATLPDQTICKYSGAAQINEDNGRVTGHVAQKLASGPADVCPATMNAHLEGTYDGSTIEGILDGGLMFGLAQFMGTMGSKGISGSFQTLQEAPPATAEQAALAAAPFPGVSGSWNARMANPLGIPVLSLLGYGLLLGVLSISSFFLLRGQT